MRGPNPKASRTAGLLALVLGAVALLALTGIASAKDRGGDDNGGHHGRHHHHHLREVREAGTISSFDAAGGKLTIALKGGESVSGLVTAKTRIECEGVDDRLTRRDHGSDDNGGRANEPGDDHGGHGNKPGDDHGGRGTEPGDDNGGQGQEPGDDHGGRSQEPGDDNGGHGEEPGDHHGGEVAPMPNPGQLPASCGVGSLTPGAFVGDAELRVGTGRAVFTEVELGHRS